VCYGERCACLLYLKNGWWGYSRESEFSTHNRTLQVQRNNFQVMEKAISVDALQNRLKQKEAGMSEMEQNTCIAKELKRVVQEQCCTPEKT